MQSKSGSERCHDQFKKRDQDSRITVEESQGENEVRITQDFLGVEQAVRAPEPAAWEHIEYQLQKCWSENVKGYIGRPLQHSRSHMAHEGGGGRGSGPGAGFLAFPLPGRCWRILQAE